jgi:hypothetical protein
VPIFSNRSIVRMMDHLVAVLGPERREGWRSRLDGAVEPAIAAEWEIAALYCLAKQGNIETAPVRENVGDLEVIYTSRATGVRVAVEVTAVSDRSFYQANPTQAFSQGILDATFKHNIHKIGAIRYQIGNVPGPRGPILGLPPIKELPQFFHTPTFKKFVTAIKKQPTQTHVLAFEYNNATSRLQFEPGPAIGGGAHIVHNLLFDPHKNPITSRLDAKDEQIARAKVDLPAVVVLCDADCNALHATSRSFGATTVLDVIKIYLNVRRQSRRINGVSVWPVLSEHDWRSGQPPRHFVVPKHVRTAAETYFPLDDATLTDISESSSHLPSIVRTPVNAKQKSKWPFYFSRISITGENPMRIRMSLLSLQYLLSGQIPADKFAQGNPELMRQFKSATDRGFIISSLTVVPSPDQDDDWLDVEMTQTAPSHAFKSAPVT